MINHLPLHEEFKRLGASFMQFSSWEVPAYFTSIIDEHTTVRTAAGLFDISHMGIIFVSGTDASAFLQYLTTNNVALLEKNRAQYATLCNESGGIIDDIFVYKRSRDDYFLVVNAGNSQKDFDWLSTHAEKYTVSLTNGFDKKALFALQGPRSSDIINTAWGIDLEALPFHSFIEIQIENTSTIIATTGYTGERGCEIIFDIESAPSFWNQLMDAGKSFGLKPIGFGARDTLRLEAGCVLYGHEIDDTTTPLEAGLGWIVKWDKDFIGKEKLFAQKKAGIQKKLISFEMLTRVPSRHGYVILKDGKDIGVVTSGSFCPTIGKSVGMGYVCIEYATVDEIIDIEVRGKSHQARIVKRPFYSRKKEAEKNVCKKG